MARPNPLFVCGSCGGETLKWQGQCPLCGEWNSLAQRSAPSARAAPAAAVSLASGVQSAVAAARVPSGTAELDRVLGGGLVPGSVTLLGGEPGIGKSTLLLQLAAHVGATQPVLYASGEESVAQVSLRAQRLALSAAGLRLAAETELPAILALAAEVAAAVLVIDSIQTVQSGAAGPAAGAISQLRECTAALVRFAKSSGTAVIIIGHLTKEGTIAGPRLLEHLVDTVLYFGSEAGSRYRIVRATKNRFGAANVLGYSPFPAGGLR
jgi:DNA repair protein RadA/Sms